MRRTSFLLFLLYVLSPLMLQAQNWEVDMVRRINHWDGKLIHDYSHVISKTEPFVAVGVPAAMLIAGALKKDRLLVKDAFYVGVSVAGAFAISMGTKLIVDRRRPYVAYPELIHPHSTERGSSFPSAHTASAFALATSLSIRYPKWYVIAPSTFWACSVGLSRMYEGVHYPTDVLAGAAIGVGSTFLSMYLSRRISKWLLGY